MKYKTSVFKSKTQINYKIKSNENMCWDKKKEDYRLRLPHWKWQCTAIGNLAKRIVESFQDLLITSLIFKNRIKKTDRQTDEKACRCGECCEIVNLLTTLASTSQICRFNLTFFFSLAITFVANFPLPPKKNNGEKKNEWKEYGKCWKLKSCQLSLVQSHFAQKLNWMHSAFCIETDDIYRWQFSNSAHRHTIVNAIEMMYFIWNWWATWMKWLYSKLM